MEHLARRWESIPRPEKIRRLQSLIGGGWEIRPLARALKVVSESRIRQLLKSATPEEHQTASISVKPKSGTNEPHDLPQRQDHELAESPDRANQTPSAPVISSSSRKQSAAVDREEERGVRVQPPAMARNGRERPEIEEAKQSSAEAATREEPKAGGHAAKPAAPDYAIEDPEAGGQLVAAWIHSNFKYPEWSEVIADYKTAYWFTRPSICHEVKLVSNIPAGLTPNEVIRYCRSDAIKAGLEGGFYQDARKKWFVCWASILLPDPAIRQKAVEIAGKILARPAVRWSYMAYDPHLNQPTPCLRSQGIPLADFLEGLTRYVDFRSLLLNGGQQKAEVEEALRYAAATLREGSPPPLD